MLEQNQELRQNDDGRSNGCQDISSINFTENIFSCSVGSMQSFWGQLFDLENVTRALNGTGLEKLRKPDYFDV